MLSTTLARKTFVEAEALVRTDGSISFDVKRGIGRQTG